ncbi:MAG: ABC transporter permease [Treponema sp.]|nr:ABC transporter permease [Candidatus Treponema caballi]
MSVIGRLALRNISEHKSKTIIIALFLVFGIAIVILGNSFLESINRGLEKDFRAHYTGDIAIAIKPERGTIIDIFGVTTTNISGEIPQIPALPELDRVYQIMKETDGIADDSKLISANVLVAHGEEMDFNDILNRDDLGFDDIPISILWGVESESYWDLFPDLNFVEGRYFEPDTDEVIIDTRVKTAFESLYRKKLNMGDKVLVAGANTNGIVREATVVGVFDPPDVNSAMFQIIYCNPGLARSFADLTYGSGIIEELPDSIDLALGSLSEDELFGFSDDGDMDAFGDISFDGDFAFEDISFDEDPFAFDDPFAFSGDDGFDESVLAGDVDFDAILGDTSRRDELNRTDDGAWNFIIAKVKRSGQADRIVAELNERFEAEGLNVQAMNWKSAAYSYTETVEGIGFIFNLLIIILAVVVFIIIMNTMTVSVIERTGEIGTMRAIGAEKHFVRRLFFTETLMLTSVSSVLGIIIAFIAMGIFNSMNITITNSIAKMILGGGLMHFSPTVTIIGVTVLVALAGSILSNLYPVSSALKITPLKALSKSDS